MFKTKQLHIFQDETRVVKGLSWWRQGAPWCQDIGMMCRKQSIVKCLAWSPKKAWLGASVHYGMTQVFFQRYFFSFISLSMKPLNFVNYLFFYFYFFNIWRWYNTSKSLKYLLLIYNYMISFFLYITLSS